VKIVVAPNAMKGSLSAPQAADAMAIGIQRAAPDASIQKLPVADGGDGLLEVLAGAFSAETRTEAVENPLGERLQAAFLFSPSSKLAIIEMATASGLALLADDALDPMHASSRGVGQLIRAALELGAEHIVLGIGGSATTDGGTGMATALGARFIDASGKALAGNGATLQSIRQLDLSELDPRLQHIKFDVACDVDNPLLGEHGAAAVYAPQKGASPEQVDRLEAGLDNYARVIEEQLGIDVRHQAGAGAAGGLGAGLIALFNADLKPGAKLVLELLGAEQVMREADLVLTCEGRLDEQTRFGKAPAEVAQLARRCGVPCFAIAGMLDESAYRLGDSGIDAVFSLCPGPLPLENALANAAAYLADTTEQVIRCYLTGRSFNKHHRKC